MGTERRLGAVTVQIRVADESDVETIAEFNCRLAEETENHHLDHATVLAGVAAALADPNKGRYFVAEEEGRLAGQLMHTWEWSDWRNGMIWWLQSVYVHHDFRRRGIFRALYRHVEALAQSDPGVAGLRLYVERGNSRARRTYVSLGMRPTGYDVMEQMFQT